MVYTQQNSMYLTKIQNHQQANCNNSTVNDEIVVNQWDATFYSKLNILNIYVIYKYK